MALTVLYDDTFQGQIVILRTSHMTSTICWSIHRSPQVMSIECDMKWSGEEWSGVEWNGVECNVIQWKGVGWGGVE